METDISTIIHKSPVLLTFKIIILEVLIELLYLVISGLAQLIGQQFDYNIRLISPLTQLLLLPVQISVLVFLLTKWSGETYEIQKEEIIIRSGILKRTEKAYPFRNMQSVIVRQSILERLVGAGSVSVFIPTLGTDLVFFEVPNPHKFAEQIKEATPDQFNSQFIMRK